ncbi:MAG: GPW/gp25 family protein [bacterium]
MVKKVDDIKAEYWSRKVGCFGEVVENEYDIEQSINIIISTPKGTVPMLPDFGSDIDECVDMPVNDAVAFINQYTIKALQKWEKRIKINSVTTTVEQEHLTVLVDYTVVDSNENKQTRVQL